DKESDGIARHVFDEIRSGGDVTADPHLDASIRTPLASMGFAQIRSQLPPGPPTKVNNAGFSYNSSSGTGSTARLSHQYAWGPRSVTIQTFLKKPPGGTAWFVTAVEADLGGPRPAIVVGTEPSEGTNSE
ncbi:MAG TPA: hypothetical protein VFE13_17945, partial [Caulobacteraceae bacterium]|nr:hypothetical protein [Caulobacteraceae bacterium]